MQQVFRIKTGKWYKFPGILFPGLVLHRCQRAVGWCRSSNTSSHCPGPIPFSHKYRISRITRAKLPSGQTTPAGVVPAALLDTQFQYNALRLCTGTVKQCVCQL